MSLRICISYETESELDEVARLLKPLHMRQTRPRPHKRNPKYLIVNMVERGSFLSSDEKPIDDQYPIA